jgi:opacity protein-like surface antigen
LNIFKKFTLFLVTLVVTSSAIAKNDSEGLYIGTNVGRGNLEFGSFSKSANILGLTVGYHSNDWFGMEGNLTKSGDFQTGLAGENMYYGNNEITINRADISITTFSLTPKFTLVLNDMFSVYAKLGISYIDGNSELSTSDFYVKTKADGIGYTAGIGVHGMITDNLDLILAYEITGADLSVDNENNDNVYAKFSQYSIGLQYNF